MIARLLSLGGQSPTNAPSAAIAGVSMKLPLMLHLMTLTRRLKVGVAMSSVYSQLSNLPLSLRMRRRRLPRASGRFPYLLR